MLQFKDKKIIFLSPHTDDVEIGCGGTLMKALEQGAQVHVCCFSSCKESVDEFECDNILEAEFRDSMESLSEFGVTYELLNYRVRYFSYERQPILEKMVEISKEYNPDIIFVPSSQDIHQDHAAIHLEALRAFKRKTLLGYDMPWNNYSSSPNLYVEINEGQFEAKIKLVSNYKSQIFKGRPYTSREYIDRHLKYRGDQVGVKRAEVFEVLRMRA